MITISYSKHITENFKAIQKNFEDIYMITGTYNYSFGIFKDGYRNIENTESISQLLCYDIDDGLSIQECMALLSNWKHMVITTKSHQKLKNGFKCDRYRLLLPLSETPYMDDYSEFYDYVGNMLGIQHDRATKDISRFYFPNKEQRVFTNLDANVLDHSLLRTMFLSDKARKIEEQRTKNNNIKITLEGDISNLIEWFKINTNDGGRNNMLFRLRKALENEQMADAEIVKVVKDVNDSLDNPLSEKEVERTILKGKL